MAAGDYRRAESDGIFVAYKGMLPQGVAYIVDADYAVYDDER